MPARALRVAMIQNSAGADPAANLDWIGRRVAALPPVDVIVLPEVFLIRGTEGDYRDAAEPLVASPTMRTVARWARERHAWIVAGSVIEASAGKVFNTCALLDRAGRIKATYRKIHLFEAHLEDGRVIRESDSYSAGRQPVIVDIEGWRAGLSLCYDLRFPELFRYYSRCGASLLFAPSNFTQRTGRDHWEILVRARAIENQCFVVAPNQCGRNPRTGVASHGHSMAVGPWGEVLATAGARQTSVVVTLDPAVIEAVRRRIPALSHRVLG